MNIEINKNKIPTKIDFFKSIIIQFAYENNISVDEILSYLRYEYKGKL